MKFGLRMPSFKKRFAARTSWKRYVRHNLGFKAPRGWGWLTNPKKAAYNRMYNRTTFSIDQLFRGHRHPQTSTGCAGCSAVLGALVVLMLGCTAVSFVLSAFTTSPASIATTSPVSTLAQPSQPTVSRPRKKKAPTPVPSPTDEDWTHY